ncbi:MAG: YfhO family protein [Clostridia bacterium]|nr:YfhO family protein [Clostridia bacterium]
MSRKKDFMLIAFLSFAVMTCALIPILVANGGNLYLVGDYMTQQVPFMRECRRMFLSGAPFWSSNTFLGANFLGSYSFYVYGSPFFWPLLLIPESCMGIGLSVMFVLKHVVAALTSYMYLRKHTKLSYLAVIGALLYAFSSFSMDSSYYYHFLDVVAFFPLIPYFTDAVLEKKKMPLLSLSAFLCAITNYYFFVGTSVFFLIYIAFRVLYSQKYTFKDAARCIAFYAIGGLASAVVLLPSALTLLETSKATGSFSKVLLSSLTTLPQIIKILKGIVLPSEGILGSATGFVYASYCSNAAFLPFFGALFFFTALRCKEKTWDFKIVKFLFVLTLVPFGNGLFSFMTNLNYTRWWYAFVLMMVMVSLRVLEEFEQDRERAAREYKKSAGTILKISLAVTVPIAVVKILAAYVLSDFIESCFPKSLIKYLYSSGLTDKFTADDLRYLAVFVFLIVLTYLPLYLGIKKQWIYSAKKVIPIVAVICTLSYSVYLCNECGWFKAESTAAKELSSYAQSEEISYSSRTDFKKSYANYSMVVNEPSISTFNSFKSHATSDFCRIAGYEIGSMPTTKAYFSTPAIQTVLSVAKVADEDAPYYAGFGYTYDYFVVDDGYEFTKDKKENNRRIQLMTKACILDKETADELSYLLKPLENTDFDWKAASKNAAQTACVNFELTSAGFEATSVGEGERLVYFSIPHDDGWSAEVNGEEAKIYTLNGGMMGVVVPDGESDISFKFVTPGLRLGALISLLSFAVLGAYSVVCLIKKRKAE